MLPYFLSAYLKRRNSKIEFKKKEKQFVKIMGISLFKNPYHIQLAMPHSKIRIITREIFSAFFSLKVLISCGSMEIEVKIPAPIPIIWM